MRVEFVGPPGAGKSTVAQHLSEVDFAAPLHLLSFDDYQSINLDYGEKSIMQMPRVARWAILARFALRRPKLTLAVAGLIFLHGRPLLRRGRKAQRVLAHFIFAERLEARFADWVVVHHDGFTQCLWSTVIDSGSLRGKGLIRFAMRQYYDRFRTRLIVFEASDELVAGRVFTRVSRGRFNRESSEVRKAEFGRWLGYHRELRDLLPEDLEKIPIDADSTPRDLALGIAVELEKFWEDEIGTTAEVNAREASA